jgi:signal transduction histidine kinase
MRHGHASRVRVTLREEDGTVLMRVEDNGRGFDPAEAARSGGLGLLGMRERLARLAGELTIHSAPRRGTCIAARVGASGPPPEA